MKELMNTIAVWEKEKDDSIKKTKSRDRANRLGEIWLLRVKKKTEVVIKW